LGYADVFDFPLTGSEIWRNLIMVKATEEEVLATLVSSRLLTRLLTGNNGYYTLTDRDQLVEQRCRRAAASAQLWPRARHYGAQIAALPFVRMVAVTGALAVNNATVGDDVDYLVVTEPGRLWLARAFTILLVKRSARQGDLICPNYFLTVDALALQERDLFTAHELAQMVPLAGYGIYRQMLAQNSWARDFLPNMQPAPHAGVADVGPVGYNQVVKIAEILLRTAPGGWLERWEMARKQARFGRQAALIERGNGAVHDANALTEWAFSAQRCKGHFNRHGRQTLQSYNRRLEGLRGHSIHQA
jgi:hypothetical protein